MTMDRSGAAYVLLHVLASAFAGSIFLTCTSTVQQRAEPAESRTTVRVTNREFADMRIYVIHHSQRIHLGTARGGSSTVFVIPVDVVTGTGIVRFVAIPIGGGQTVIEEYPMRLGEEVTIFIPPA
ncbi:MAG: hypothetical protein ABR543_06465 [Gemmatimonadaceae bacterium]